MRWVELGVLRPAPVDRPDRMDHVARRQVVAFGDLRLPVVAAHLQEVTPPREVADAFRDVASAREDKSRTVNEAEGYHNDLIPKAKGEAAKMLNAAGFENTALMASCGAAMPTPPMDRPAAAAADSGFFS